MRLTALLLAASLAAPSPSSAAALAGRVALPQGRVIAVPPSAGLALTTRVTPLSLAAPSLAPTALSLTPNVSLAPKLAVAAAASPDAAKAAPIAPAAVAADAAAPLAQLIAAPADAPRPDEAPEKAAQGGRERFDASAPERGDDATLGGESAAPSLDASRPSSPAAKAQPPSFSKRPGFGGLTRTHFLGVFNDTALKTLFIVWVTGVVGGDLANLYIGAATAAFTLPYVILSSYAGPLADRVENRRLIRVLKLVEIGIVGFAAALFAVAGHAGPGAGILSALVLSLGAMGVHSAFLSPAKERMLSKLVPEQELGSATARFNVFTFTGIVGGMIAGTALETLTGSVALSALILVAVSGLGYWASKSLAVTPASGDAPKSIPRELASYMKGLRGTLRADWHAVRSIKAVKLVVMGLAWYWFIGSIGQINMPGFVKEVLGLSDLWLSAFLATLTLGIGVGATVAEKLQKNGVRLNLAVYGAVGMSAFLFMLGILGPAAGLALCFVAALGLGASSGLFNVPLNAQLLAVTPADQRGRYIGAANFVIFAGLALSAAAFALFPALNLLFHALGLSWHLGPQAVFFAMGVVALLLARRTKRDLPGMKP